tara:strand:- start:1023 stop:1175 length:153 start_codon:yes stop_codon:yes gene_type:complete
METVTISKQKYEEILRELEMLKEMQKQTEDDELLEQFKESLEDVRLGRIT